MPNSIGVVRHVGPDGLLLVEEGFRLLPVQNPTEIPVELYATLEFNDIDGVVSVRSDEPIRVDVRREETDPELGPSPFRVELGADGPNYSDFGGYESVVERARDLIATQLEQADAMREIGAAPVRGVLFSGPPGTGKTFLARIIAQHSAAAFFLVNGPSIISKYLGDTERALRSMFDEAASCERAIIFIDEIDAIAQNRSQDVHEQSRKLVAQLLTLMDGFQNAGGNVVVVAATNRVETLDPAVTRPGRFDWTIDFGLPTRDDRLAILESRAAAMTTDDDLDLVAIAEKTSDWTAADLELLWREAALLALKDSRRSVAGEDIERALAHVSRRKRERST